MSDLINKLLDPIVGWKNYYVKPDVEEAEKDIQLAIKYEDHGDSFLLIKTNDGKCYRYGYFINREDCRFIPDGQFIRKTRTFKKPDDRAVVANDLYFKYRYYFSDKNGIYVKPKKYKSTMLAQYAFDSYLLYFNKALDGEYIVHEQYGMGKYNLIEWLKLNDIYTEENVRRLEKQEFNNRQDGKYDGIAGKVEYIYDDIWFDTVSYIYANGKEYDSSDVPTKFVTNDEWGYPTYSLSLKIFERRNLNGTEDNR